MKVFGKRGESGVIVGLVERICRVMNVGKMKMFFWFVGDPAI